MLIPPCGYAEQKDEVWFQLRGQGAEVDGRQETPYLYLLRACGFIRQLSNSTSADGCLWCQEKNTGLWGQMQQGLNLDPFSGSATSEAQTLCGPQPPPLEE